jgi:hypothetical protein
VGIRPLGRVRSASSVRLWIDACDDDDYSRIRGTTLAELAPYLPRELLADALTNVLDATSSFDDRARALAMLAPHLPNDLLADALTLSAAIEDPSTRTLALAALANFRR